MRVWQRVAQRVLPPPRPVTGCTTMLLILVGLGTFKMVVRAHEPHSRLKSGPRLQLIHFVFTTSEFRRNPKVSICFTLSAITSDPTEVGQAFVWAYS